MTRDLMEPEIAGLNHEQVHQCLRALPVGATQIVGATPPKPDMSALMSGSLAPTDVHWGSSEGELVHAQHIVREQGGARYGTGSQRSQYRIKKNAGVGGR